jgi:hypothetical protein
VSDLLIGFLLGSSTILLGLHYVLKRYLTNKAALRRIIAEAYHRNLLPEICRAEGLVDLATRDGHYQYAKLALIEIRRLKERFIKIIKRYEPYQ